MMAKSMASKPTNDHPRSCASALPKMDNAYNALHCLLARNFAAPDELEGGYLAPRLSNNCSYQASSSVMPGLHWPEVGLVGEPPTLPKDAPGTFFSHLSYGGDV